MSIPRNTANYYLPKSERTGSTTIKPSGKIPDHLLVKQETGRFGVVVVMLTIIAAFSAMIIMAYSNNINGSKRPPAVSKESGQYQTSQFSPEAKLRDSQDIAALQKRYMNSPTDAERKQVIQELHRRLATIPYGTLPEDQQKFVALFY